MNSFTINGKTFTSAYLHGLNSFQVKSALKPYVIYWDESDNPFQRINALLKENSNNVLLIDENVLRLYQSFLTVELSQIFSVNASESFKTLESVTALLDFLCQRDFTKDEKLIVVGGGIIQEIGAFVGTCYKRGIKWVHFPTTLLSMSDSCLGGKIGINYKGVKNQIALFGTPTAVVIHPFFLQSLTEEALRSGLGEILKSCIIGGEAFLSIYQQCVQQGKVHSLHDYKILVLNALSIKRAIVEEDEFELNHRRSLNYGHTLGHAIEVMSDYAITHGLAVTLGMIVANELSYRRNLLKLSQKERLNKLCRELLPDTMGKCMQAISFHNLLPLLQKDKKAESRHVSFVMMKEIGDIHFIKLLLNNDLLNEIEQIVQGIF